MSKVTTENIDSSAWYLDSCASTHMTGRKDILKNIVECESTVKLANNQELVVKAKGDATIKVYSDIKIEEISVQDVLYVPNLAANLLSVSKIVSKGYLIPFEREKCTIRDVKKTITAKDYLQDGVYRLSTPEKKALSTRVTEKNLWHQQMGHLNRHGMLTLKFKYATGLDDLQINEAPCEACTYGKQSRLPFVNTGKRANNLLDIIHSDLCEIFIDFYNDHSRKIFVFFY